MDYHVASDPLTGIHGKVGRCAEALLVVLVILSGGRAWASENQNTATRERCVSVLRDVLKTEERWVKVHAAEYLLQLDYPDGVRETFEREREARDREPQYRIGVWRVLAQANFEEQRRVDWIIRIRDAFLDPASPDRLHAVESLAKLRYFVPRDLRGAFAEAADQPSGGLAVFASWVLVNSKEPGAESRLVRFLASPDALTRRLCAYALFRMPTLSEESKRKLAAACESAPDDSQGHVLIMAAAARHLSGATQSQCRRRLCSYLEHGAKDDRVIACEALASVAGQEDLPLLTAQLGAEDGDLRATAAWSILRMERRRVRGLGVADWLAIVIYGAAMLGVGWYYWRRNRTT